MVWGVQFEWHKGKYHPNPVKIKTHQGKLLGSNVVFGSQHFNSKKKEVACSTNIFRRFCFKVKRLCRDWYFCTMCSALHSYQTTIYVLQVLSHDTCFSYFDANIYLSLSFSAITCSFIIFIFLQQRDQQRKLQSTAFIIDHTRKNSACRQRPRRVAKILVMKFIG